MFPDFVYTIIYILICICIVYPPNEFLSAGLTLPALFSGILGKEHDQFIEYHIKRSCLYLLTYSLLPLGYVLTYYFFNNPEKEILLITESTFWRLFNTISVIFPLLAVYQVINWSRNNYEKHPIAVNVSKFCNNGMNWRSVANNINNEFRRVDKICLQTSTIIKIIATENWLLKVAPLNIFAIHQSDASLVVKEAHTYQFSPQTSARAQYLNIEIKSGRQGVDTVTIRINADDFKDLRDRVARSITILPNVRFHKTILDQFVDVFKETIKLNPVYETNQELDQCIGCLQERPSIKLQKMCEDNQLRMPCTSCYCKPMWCADCMAKWFASRQEADQRSTWLESKCTCPMCRATFCVLDVCFLSEFNTTE